MMGVFHWPPDVAWNATPFDFAIACRGWKIANGESDKYTVNSLGKRVRKCTTDDIKAYKELERARDGKF